jgi:hypothetical protein
MPPGGRIFAFKNKIQRKRPEFVCIIDSNANWLAGAGDAVTSNVEIFTANSQRFVSLIDEPV